MKQSRRTFLATSASIAVGGTFAGCIGESGGNGGDDTGYASFFTPFDIARHVSGEEFDVENPVPTGSMGHQWEPSGDLTFDIVESDVFIYFDIEGFQHWALETAEALEADHGDVVVVDALDGVDLLEYRDHGDHEGDGREDHRDDSHDESDGDDHGDDHDHGNDDGDFDPHAWLDPVRAKQITDNVAEGLAEADPDNADVYEENAAAYRERLDDLHRQFEERLGDTRNDVAVIAGHDSYQYVGRRYGFELYSPQGVSPHDESSSREVADTVELIDENGIETVLYNSFEDPTLAEQIVDESGAEGVDEVSSAEGTIEEWEERDWGYVEQMKEINLPAFENALENHQ